MGSNLPRTKQTVKQDAMELYRGLFWLIDGELVTVKLACDLSGAFLGETPVSLRGNENLTHSEAWKKLPKKVTGGWPYNYYPRGRVEVKNGRADIFLNPDIATEEVLDKVKVIFGLENVKSIKIHADGSAHYEYRQ